MFNVSPAAPIHLWRTTQERRTEFWLVIFVGLLNVGAYTLASLGADSALPANLWAVFAVFLGINLGAHIAVRILAPLASPVLLPLALLLNGLGYVMIARLDHRLASLQATWTGVAIVAFTIVLIVVKRARDLARFRYTIGLAGVVLLILPIAPGIGGTINGARLWIRIGGISFQPGEIAKVMLAIFVASYLEDKRELLSHATKTVKGLNIPDLRHFGPLVLMIVLSLATLLIQHDLGSSVLLMSMFIVTMWIATGRAVYLLGGGALAMGGVIGAYSTLAYVKNRVTTWLNPWNTAQTGGYQLVQAWFSLGSGGPYGSGLALGTPWRVPYAYNDFIFSSIGEELGLAGTAAIVIAFVLLCSTAFAISVRSSDDFEKLLASALATIVGVQALIIMCGVVRLFPLTGIALPFVAYGGSSLLTNYIVIAVLIRISHDSRLRLSRRSIDQGLLR